MRISKKHIACFATLICFFFFFQSTAIAAESPAQKYVLGGFELSGYLNTGMGWQKFWGGTPTELAFDGSSAGVLGSVDSAAMQNRLPSKNEDSFNGFVEIGEIDIKKSFGERARLRADLYFGRISSGSWLDPPGVIIEEAYAAVALSNSPLVEISLGRFGTPAGLEAFEPYNNDAISWSILARGSIYPIFSTGSRISASFANGVTLIGIAANGLSDDTAWQPSQAPCGMAAFIYSWGEAAKKSTLKITPFLGPDSQSNNHNTFGIDLVSETWLSKSVKLGIEALLRRDNGNGGPNTNYAAGIFDLRWDLTKTLYGFAKYDFAEQFESGNGVLNLTGARQQIHEISFGGGYSIADGFKIKLESRLDIVNPAIGALQWTPGIATAFSCAF